MFGQFGLFVADEHLLGFVQVVQPGDAVQAEGFAQQCLVPVAYLGCDSIVRLPSSLEGLWQCCVEEPSPNHINYYHIFQLKCK